ncbi:MAG: hypothetical protein WDN06_13630 [Asticcacaulis sp.]
MANTLLVPVTSPSFQKSYSAPVQEQLRRRNKSAHYIKLLDHPLRGIARCAVCRRLYTPYLKKGVVYYGARCERNCINRLKSFNFDFIAEKAGAVIQRLVFTEQELVTINASATTDIALIDHKREMALEENNRKKKKLREEFAYLAENRLPLLRAGVYTPETYVEEEARLNREIQAFDLKEEISCTSMLRTIEEIVLLSELLNNVVEVYVSAKPNEKDQIIRAVFSELTIAENTFDYQCTTGIKPLSDRFVANCDLKTWLSELSSDNLEIRHAIAKLAQLMPPSCKEAA